MSNVCSWFTGIRVVVTVLALKRKSVPRNGLEYYLAISYSHDQHGWRLRPVPANYELRYVCEKGSLFSHFLLGMPLSFNLLNV